MYKRPKSVTVLSWLLLINGLLGFMAGTQALAKLMQGPSVQGALAYISSLVLFVSGVAMLRGFNWARLLCVAWLSVVSVIGFVILPMPADAISGFITAVAVAYYLYLPASSEYFLQRSLPALDLSIPALRKLSLHWFLLAPAVAALVVQALRMRSATWQQIVSYSDARMYRVAQAYSGELAALFLFASITGVALLAYAWKKRALGLIWAALSAPCYLLVFSLTHGGGMSFGSFLAFEFFNGTQGYESNYARTLQDTGVPVSVARALDLANPSVLMTSVLAVGFVWLCYAFFNKSMNWRQQAQAMERL